MSPEKILNEEALAEELRAMEHPVKPHHVPEKTKKPEEYFGEETDCMGNCFSDADPGL